MLAAVTFCSICSRLLLPFLLALAILSSHQLIVRNSLARGTRVMQNANTPDQKALCARGDGQSNTCSDELTERRVRAGARPNSTRRAAAACPPRAQTSSLARRGAHAALKPIRSEGESLTKSSELFLCLKYHPHPQESYLHPHPQRYLAFRVTPNFQYKPRTWPSHPIKSPQTLLPTTL